MKKTIAETSKTKSRFSEKIKKKTLINPKPDSSRKKGRGFKSIKLEMKKETLQWTPQEYKGS